MARKAALVVTWTQPTRGREGKALESFTDFLTFWGKLAADGKVGEPEPFFSGDGGKGFAVVRGTPQRLDGGIRVNDDSATRGDSEPDGRSLQNEERDRQQRDRCHFLVDVLRDGID